MKNVLLFIALFSASVLSAQNFSGESVALLEGKELKVKPLEKSGQKYGYREFYTDSDLKKVYKKDGFNTKYSALSDKVFKVVSYEPFNSHVGTKYKLKIENPDTGILYYKYDPKFSVIFPFEVIGGLTYPDGFFCNQIKEESPVGDAKRYQFKFADGVQIIQLKDEENNIYANINLPVNSKIAYNVMLTGAVLELENGQSINLPSQKISHEDNGAGGTVINALITLSNEHTDLLKKHKLFKIKFDKYERTYDEGLTLQEYIKCVAN